MADNINKHIKPSIEGDFKQPTIMHGGNVVSPGPEPQILTPHSSKDTTPSRGSSPFIHAPPFQSIKPEDAEHIWLVTGPAGCGKTTIAKYLAWQLSLPYVEGDDFHPSANKAKMSSGQGLNDSDRWDWLVTLREEAIKRLTDPDSAVSAHQSGSSPSPYPRGVIVTCSALKLKYRDVIRIAAYTNPTIQVHFIYLRASKTSLLERVAARQGHYMKSGMVESQFEDLEEPSEAEVAKDVLIVNVEAAPEVVQTRALEAVRGVLKEYEADEVEEVEAA